MGASLKELEAKLTEEAKSLQARLSLIDNTRDALRALFGAATPTPTVIPQKPAVSKVAKTEEHSKHFLGSRAFRNVYKGLNKERQTMPTGRLVVEIMKHGARSTNGISIIIWRDRRVTGKPDTEKGCYQRVQAAVNHLRRDGKVKLTTRGWVLVKNDATFPHLPLPGGKPEWNDSGSE
jgi:hypothetical protein